MHYETILPVRRRNQPTAKFISPLAVTFAWHRVCFHMVEAHLTPSNAMTTKPKGLLKLLTFNELSISGLVTISIVAGILAALLIPITVR